MSSAASPIKPALPTLKTPASASLVFPSSALPRSPYSAWPSSAGVAIKQEPRDDVRTPITPPTAYTDFLKALSPALSTPATARSAYSAFSFTDRAGHLTPVTQPSSAASSNANLTLSPAACNCRPKLSAHGSSGSIDNKAGVKPAPSAHGAAPRSPPLPAAGAQTTSTTTTTSTTSTSTTSSTVTAPADNPRRFMQPSASAPLVPPTPFARPAQSSRARSARTPTTLKRLRIPQSPYTSLPATESPCSGSACATPCSAASQGPRPCSAVPAGAPHPHHGSCAASPRSASPQSAGPRVASPTSSTVYSTTTTTLRSPYSPTSWYAEGRTRTYGEPPRTGAPPKAVSIRQVVTRTVTYTSTPLDPAPRGKRRKVEE